jgi:RecG-like helicase
MGWWRRMLERLRQDEGERRSATIREWSASQTGCTLIGGAQPRSIVRIAGVVEALRVRPREGVPQIEAQLSDGTGAVTAVWIGRRTIPGLALGVRMVIEGRLGAGADGLQILNPRFEFGQRQGEVV